MGHPLIHVGYAYEISSRTVAIEALGLAACFYDDLHKYIDDPSYTRPPSFKSKDPLEILQMLEKDERFDNLLSEPGEENIAILQEKHQDLIAEYWNAWDVSYQPEAQFEASQRAATALVVATHSPEKNYDFFLLHLLTTSHAVRILLPIVPPKFQVPLVRQWWLFTILGYTGQLRPHIDLSRIEDFPLGGQGWSFVDKMALTSSHAQDAHYVKGLRAMKNAAQTWGDKDEYYVKAAVKLAGEFSGWGYT